MRSLRSSHDSRADSNSEVFLQAQRPGSGAAGDAPPSIRTALGPPAVACIRKLDNMPRAWDGVYLHNPLGVQSDTGMPEGWDVSCKMSTSERRFSVPVAVSFIGGPAGTIVLSPARPTSLPLGVSRHTSPDNVYQASGPGCRCTGVVMPGLKTATMYWAVYVSPGFTCSGPISATRTAPGEGCQPASPIANNQVPPSPSMTVPRRPLTASASGRLG